MGEAQRWRFLAPRASTTLSPLDAPPSLSVVIAAYRARETVAEAVRSALEQTLPPTEVIVVDDASHDGTESVLEPYRDRITFIAREENGGEGAAKNTGIEAASGEFVVFLDADDIFLPQRLEALGAFAVARPDLDILTTDAYLVHDGQRLRRAYEQGFSFEVDDQRRGILERNFILGHTAVRRSRLVAVGGFDEAIRRTTDWDLWLRMIFAGSRAGLIDAPLSHYRLHETALSSDRLAMTEGKLQTLEKARRSSLGLSAAERATLDASISHLTQLARLEAAVRALAEGSDRARRLAVAIATSRDYGLATRAKAFFAAVAPAAARRLLRRRGEGFVGVGDIRPTTSERTAASQGQGDDRQASA